MRTKTIFFFATAFIFGLSAGCSSKGKTDRSQHSKLHVFASIPPVAYFVERIGGDRVDVSVLVEPGVSPHSYEPTPKQVMELGGSDLLFRLGMPFEDRLIGRLFTGTNRKKVIDLGKSITKLKLTPHDSHDNHTENHNECMEPELDPHIWLSPLLIPVQARNIADGLIEIDPSNRDYYLTNLAVFISEVDSVHQVVKKVLEPHHGRSFYTFHPAFGYLADAYGLVQEAVEIEGKSPSPKAINQLIEQARKEGVRIVFVQPQFDDKSAKSIAQAIDGAIVPMDALIKDVLENLLAMAAKIDSALQE